MSRSDQPATIRPARAPLPEFDGRSEFYWTSGQDGVLRILRCRSCRHWLHPPPVRCTNCGGRELTPEPVSGDGTVVTFAVNHHPWVPEMEVPFIIGVIELDCQAGLFVVSNLGCAPDQARIGMAVQVSFEQVDDVWFPVFSPSAT